MNVRLVHHTGSNLVTITGIDIVDTDTGNMLHTGLSVPQKCAVLREHPEYNIKEMTYPHPYFESYRKEE